jgi:hypothetical protein
LLLDEPAPGERSGSPLASAQRKAQTKPNSEDLWVQSFPGRLKDFATITQNHAHPKMKTIPAFGMLTCATTAEHRGVDLPAISL